MVIVAFRASSGVSSYSRQTFSYTNEIAELSLLVTGVTVASSSVGLLIYPP